MDANQNLTAEMIKIDPYNYTLSEMVDVIGETEAKKLFKSIYNPYFIFADTIARLFCYEYPVCYAYHTKNKETGGHHSHFHYVVSTSSYISDHPALDADRLLTYLPKMQEIAWEYNLKLYHHQREEELQCLNLTTIF